MIDENKALGAYIGAAIGDAMGGPVECQHAARITKHYGKITGLIEYHKPPGLMDLHPGYALHSDAGSITDDTYIRADFTRFFLNTPAPRTAGMLANWLLENADFTMWWKPAVEALKKIERGETTPETGGESHPQGGGIGWWTPLGILHAGSPASAAAEARVLCTIWKRPLEQDFLAATQAGLAAATGEHADIDAILNAMYGECGTLGSALLDRSIDIARTADTFEDLWNRIYEVCLVNDASAERNGPLPEIQPPLEYSDTGYSSVLWAEQIPLAVAALVFSKGDPVQSIPNCVMLGRDADSTATTVGSWIGALHGLDAFPKTWVEKIIAANKNDCDILGLGEALVAAG